MLFKLGAHKAVQMGYQLVYKIQAGCTGEDTCNGEYKSELAAVFK